MARKRSGSGYGGCLLLILIGIVCFVGLIVNAGKSPRPDTPAPPQTSKSPPWDEIPVEHHPPEHVTPLPDGRIHVRGYQRKDGTYVKPHTRTR